MPETITIPAGTGKAVKLSAGSAVKVINTHGSQVVDTWALTADQEHVLSMPHTRVALSRLRPRQGDELVTEERRPLLILEEDTSPGVHDTLCAACDPDRFRLLGVEGHHRSCAENFEEGLAELGVSFGYVPAPLNLFMNIPWTADGEISFDPPLTKPGDYVVLRAVVDAIVAFSSCPQDLLLINGTERKPMPVDLELIPA